MHVPIFNTNETPIQRKGCSAPSLGALAALLIILWQTALKAQTNRYYGNVKDTVVIDLQYQHEVIQQDTFCVLSNSPTKVINQQGLRWYWHTPNCIVILNKGEMPYNFRSATKKELPDPRKAVEVAKKINTRKRI